MAGVFINLGTVTNIMGNGKKIKWMEKEFILPQLAIIMKDSFLRED